MINQIALVSQTDQVTMAELTVVSAAVQKQLNRDVAPFWDVDGTVDSFASLEDVPLGYWPVIIKDEQGRWKCVAAGPTTSIREEPYQWQIIRDFGLRGVIGKGGMGERTVQACKEHGCVYLHAIGGAAQVLAECIKSVPNVYLMEKFGAPEAIWEFEVKEFPAVVTIDAHGNSLHKQVFAASQAELAKYL